MKKSGLVNSLSALILLAFGVIWLVYLCAGNAMSEPVQNGLSLTVSLLALLTYMLKAICNSRNMPVWLVWIIVIAIIGAVPANIVELLETCNIDISHINPILDQVISISHGITFII